MATFDPNAYNLLNIAVTREQQQIAQWQNMLRQAQAQRNQGAIGMLQAAIARSQGLLKNYRGGLQQQVAAFPVQVDNAGFAQQKADISNQYGTQLAGVDYATQVARQRQARQVGDFNINAYRQREQQPNQFLRRGIYNSGLRRADLSRMREDQTRQYGALTEGHAQELGQLAQQRTGVQAQQQSALNAVDRARQRAIQQQLQQLQAAAGIR